MNTIDVFTNEYKVTKKQIRWVALLTFICSLYIPLASFGQEIKVMTYNIYHGEEYYSPGEKNLEKSLQLSINTNLTLLPCRK